MPELIRLYEEPVFIGYAVGVGIICSIGYVLSKYIERVYAEFGAWSEQYARYQKVRWFS